MTYENPGNNQPPAEEEEYRGTHRRADDEPAGSTAAAAGGLPARGLGMILIAVAAILLLWGVYVLTQQDPADNAEGEQGEQGEPAAESISAEPTAPAPPATATPGAGASDSPTSPTETAETGETAGTAAPPAGQPAPAPAPGGAQLTADNAEVFVFNNSPTPDLAARTAGDLEPEYTVRNRSGDAAQMNLPEQNFGVFPETFVFFDPAVAGAEEIASDIAGRVGGAPRSVRDLPEGTTLPPEATANANAVTVVLAG